MRAWGERSPIKGEKGREVSEKILVVDDEPRVVQLVRVVLEAVGYDVCAAVTGESAVEMVALEQPDLVLLDIRLPNGPDGYEVCDELKKSKETESIPVIFLTGKDAKSDEGRSFQVGGDMYIKKPFSCDRLLEIVRIVLMSINK